MQGLIRCVVVAGLLTGCNPGDVDPPMIDGMGSGSGSGDSGMVVEWSSTPPSFPSTLGNGVMVEQARFGLETLRVVGDAGPGDPRTTATALTLSFNWSGGGESPEAIPFDEAPLGLYSQVALAFDGSTMTNGESYEIRGKATVNSQLYDFRIEDANPLTFNVTIDKMVNPGETAVVHLRINFQLALESLDWETLDRGDGRIELEEGDTQMAMFRTKLQESFEIVNVTSRPVN